MTDTIIPYRFYRHVSGRSASLYGAVPWRTASEEREWSVVTSGYTISWADGTIGTGKPPFATVADAETYLARLAARGFRGGFRDMTY